MSFVILLQTEKFSAMIFNSIFITYRFFLPVVRRDETGVMRFNKALRIFQFSIGFMFVETTDVFLIEIDIKFTRIVK